MEDKVLQRLLSRIKERGLNEKETLIACEINTNFFVDWKKKTKEGKNMYPAYDKIVKIATFLNLSLDYVLLGKETQQDISYSSNASSLTKESKKDLEKFISFLQYKEEKEKAHLHLVAEEDVPYSTTKNIVPIGHIKEETDSAKEKELHILGYTAAGEPIDMPDDTYGLEDVIKVPADNKADFALTVKGDSMEPRIPNESVVYVKKQDTVDNGQIAIVSINNTVTCKIFKQKNDIIYLHSINPNYDPIIIDNEDIDFKIIGKVINPK